MSNTGKVYTLELTAEELAGWNAPPNITKARGDIGRRLDALAQQARTDREQADLRLPWIAEQGSRYHKDYDKGQWCLQTQHPAGWPGTKAAACLASAAPELLEAVKEVASLWDYFRIDGDSRRRIQALLERALRKVETGVPE